MGVIQRNILAIQGRIGLAALVFCLFSNMAFAQSAKEHLRQGIAFYQNLEFEKALVSFEKAIEIEPENLDFYARRGYVCSKYIQAVDNGKVPAISTDRYNEVVQLGLADLKKSLAEFPDNDDNQRALNFLKTKE